MASLLVSIAMCLQRVPIFYSALEQKFSSSCRKCMWIFKKIQDACESMKFAGCEDKLVQLEDCA